MKLPLSWLNDFVKVDDIPPAELAERLTRAGLQVESIDTVGGEPLSELIVVGEVVACEPHPDSDHLHVCRVTDGAETFQVVCGAPNMRLGLKTAFAKIGSPIPGFLDKKGNPEKIKKGKIRGVESFGMCAVHRRGERGNHRVPTGDARGRVCPRRCEHREAGDCLRRGCHLEPPRRALHRRAGA